MGYEGEVWPVHPGKAAIAGKRAYASVADLPGAPDAAFVGVNRHATLEVVRDLAARGAGGAVLFASGFSETGDGALTEALLDAAGGMPVLGPNCYGFVNALDGAVIWPLAGPRPWPAVPIRSAGPSPSWTRPAPR